MPVIAEPFASRVWKTLSAINVNAHAEKKGSLTYLSWSWAWSVLMSYYPESTFAFDDPVMYPDGTAEIRVTVCVTEGDQTMVRSMWLPVMDNKNNAIINPDARKVSDTKMRCLVKCLALFGLGLYIYAGEDLPHTVPENDYDYGPAMQRIAAAESIEELQAAFAAAWRDSPVTARKALTAAKDQRKAALLARAEDVIEGELSDGN